MVSYEAMLASTHSEKAMTIVDEWGFLTGVKLGPAQAKLRWNTKSGGQVQAGSIMGGVTGKPADLFIIDDPIKNDEQANSPSIRSKLLREYQAVCETRLNPTSAVILMATRWHPADLTGQVLQLEKQGGQHWEHICLPALATENDPLGRSPGESIWPERYPKEWYEERKHQYELMGHTYQWEALYQGNPVSGNKVVEWPDSYFQGIWWEGERPQPKLRVQSCDPSKGSDSRNGDWQAHVMLDLLEDGTMLVDSWLHRQTIEAMVDTILHLWQSHHPDGIVIETGFGQEGYPRLIADKAKYISAQPIPLHAFPNKMSKAVRIRIGLSHLLAQHRLKFSKTPSNQLLVSMLREFPTSTYDDGPDALELACQLLNKLTTGARQPRPVNLMV